MAGTARTVPATGPAAQRREPDAVTITEDTPSAAELVGIDTPIHLTDEDRAQIAAFVGWDPDPGDSPHLEGAA